ncbi:MAG: hypothetical protein QM831_21325 [Kofleriaceae bacterium]
MLHAELHGKLSSDIGDGAERLEDVLTSTVFGTLFAASAWKIVADWLSRARRGTDTIPQVEFSNDAVDYWFWPWLGTAEPDLIVRIGATLVIIEAKYFSGKSGSSTPTELAASTDQLVREWCAIDIAADSSGYDPRLREMVTEPATRRILIYLVRRSRYARESAELEQSLAHAPGASMYLLTWEDLDEVLAPHLHVRWASELSRYLERRRISAFRGFSRAFTFMPSRLLPAWKPQRTRTSPTFIDVIPRQPTISVLAHRSSRFAPARGWHRTVRPESTHLVHQLANRQSRFPEH